MNMTFFLLFYFSTLSVLLSGVIAVLIKYIAVNNMKTADTISPYECGFEGFGDARDSFDIKFFLVGILFLIFDLELIFLVPWALSLQVINVLGYFSMFCFLFILTVGLVYEWKKGALEW